jgi:hypothetical protein
MEESLIEPVVAATRKFDGRVFGSLIVGLGVGAAVGFYIGYRYNKKKLHAEIHEEAEREIAEVRDHYRLKSLAVEAQDKPSVDTIVKERGYSTRVTKVQPQEEEQQGRLLRPPVVVNPPRHNPREVLKEIQNEDEQKSKTDGWYVHELPNRKPNGTYIIHQDEFTQNESGYGQTTYTYYIVDDVLVEEADPLTVLHNRENLIGREALNRFGYGTDDEDVVHVRNNQLELEFEITRVDASWDEKVMGLDRNDPS